MKVGAGAGTSSMAHAHDCEIGGWVQLENDTGLGVNYGAAVESGAVTCQATN